MLGFFTKVEFPGLGWSMEVPNIAFSIFGVDIYWYAICICTGIALAVWFAIVHAKRVGIDPDRMINVVMVGIVCAIIGGRLYYVIFESGNSDITFLYIINTRQGGIGIYGGIIGAFLGAGLSCKYFKVPMLPLFDLAGIGFLIGQACGRWGNFFNQEAFGTNTNLPWGMRSVATQEYIAAGQAHNWPGVAHLDANMPVHPTFLYESLWCLLGFILLACYLKHRKFNGEIFLLYLSWYGVGRFFIEGLRTDSLMAGPFRVSQLLAFVMVIVCVPVWMFFRMKSKNKPLVVPEIPRRTAKVRLPEEAKPVVVSWSVEEKDPNRKQLLEMARVQIEKGKAEKEKQSISSIVSEDVEDSSKLEKADNTGEAGVTIDETDNLAAEKTLAKELPSGDGKELEAEEELVEPEIDIVQEVLPTSDVVAEKEESSVESNQTLDMILAEIKVKEENEENAKH